MLDKQKVNTGVDMFLLFTKIEYIIDTLCEKHDMVGVTPDGKEVPLTLVILDDTDRVNTLVKEVIEMGKPLFGEMPEQEVPDFAKFEMLANMDKNHELPYGVITKEMWDKMPKQLTNEK